MSTKWTSASRSLKVNIPDGFQAGAVPLRRARSAKRPSAADQLFAALADQGLQRIDGPVEFAPKPGAATRSLTGKATATVRATVSADEDAVILLEQDGVFSWQMPADRTPVSAPKRQRRSPTEATPAGLREITFNLSLRAEDAQIPKRRRGIIAFAGKIKAHVFKYVAGKITGLAVHHLERHVEPGLVVIRSEDPTKWHRVNSLSDVGLPKDRAARVLLLVHGTFSSTVGGFGHLGAFDWGKEFLRAALREYDAVIGYDHRTLSVDPTANASDLLAALSRGAKKPIDADVVCHSRGALVTRSLVEHLLPRHSGPGLRKIERIVFVGSPNGGTSLADPKNWHQMVDLYTNLAAAAVSTGGLLPGPHVAAVAAGVIRGLGAFVKYLASYAAGDQAGVPGLAAMNPNGAFIRELNETQLGQPTPANTQWYVITSDFEPTLALGPGGVKQLPRELLLMLADGVMDKLIGASNDLVVNTESMSAIDPAAGSFVTDGYHFGRNGLAYHTGYFSRPEVTTALTQWLCTAEANVEEVGAVVAPSVPILAHQNIVVVKPRTSAAAVATTIGKSQPDYVVMPHAGSMWAFTPDELKLAKVGSRVTQEFLRSTLEYRAHMWKSAYRRGAGRTVVLRQGTPVAVVPQPDLRPLEELLVDQKPKSGKKTASSDKVTAHFRASMASEAVVDKITTVRCTIARAALPPVKGESVGGTSIVHPDQPIIVQVIAKTNARVEGGDRETIKLPASREPTDLYFDIVPTNEGPGEIWVIARQGPAPLVTLRLTPTFTSGEPTATAERTSAEANIPTSGNHNCVKQSLRITEIRRGTDIMFQYELESGELKVLEKFTSEPLIGDRDEYVRRLYQRIEQNWATSAKDMARFEQYLQAAGGQLFDDLFPAELQRLLWDKREQLHNLWVLSTEPFIPWELVHLKDDGAIDKKRSWFLGELGMVRWLHGTYPAETVRCRDRQVRYIVPDYPGDYALPQTAAEAEFLRTNLGARKVSADHDSVLSLLKRRGSFDVLHFAGHGLAAQDNIEDASIMLTGHLNGADEYIPDLLNATMVSGFADLGNRNGRPMVMLNACQTGRLGAQLTSLGGFAKAFLDRGAGVFVSSLWEVGDSPAQAFAVTLYTELLQGRTLAEASKKARDIAREAGDCTWLAYAVYGSPCAKLVRQ